MRWETGQLGEWMDACTIAARRDPFGLAAVQALFKGPGWYTCWLRFTIGLMAAEAASADEQSRSCLEALRVLTEVQDPYLGEPRACDLYPIQSRIDETIRRAVSLLDDEAWDEALELLHHVSDATSTTISGEIGGPVRRDRLLHLAVETATPTRRAAAQILVNDEIENGVTGPWFFEPQQELVLRQNLGI